MHSGFYLQLHINNNFEKITEHVKALIENPDIVYI